MTHPMSVRLGRHVNHDERSRAFPAATGTPGTVFHHHHGPVLDQGQLGACTAFSLWQALMTDPLRQSSVKASSAKARDLYHAETVLEGQPYPPYDPGGSGLMVCKAAQQAGLITSYTHAFGLDHAKGAIAVSPFIVGTDWYTGMFSPGPTGFVTPTGKVEGGHEYLCLGYDADRDAWVFLNSWGRWGVPDVRVGCTRGVFYMTSATFGFLLDHQGDVTVPQTRAAVVGEHGPEILTLGDTGPVTPSTSPTPSPIDAIRSGAYTALWTFLASVLVMSLGWLQQVARWASSSGHSPLPGLSVIGYSVVGLATAALSGLVSTAVRLAQGRGWLPGQPPSYTPPTA